MAAISSSLRRLSREAGISAPASNSSGAMRSWSNFLAGEIPYDRSKLWLGMETKAVVYGPDVAVLVEQAMAALAVGIVGDQVESSGCGAAARCC